jgi:hypothetical protein
MWPRLPSIRKGLCLWEATLFGHFDALIMPPCLRDKLDLPIEPIFVALRIRLLKVSARRDSSRMKRFGKNTFKNWCKRLGIRSNP